MHGYVKRTSLSNQLSRLQLIVSPGSRMFRKINNAFRPNHPASRGGDPPGGGRSEEDYHNACTVKLVRSTSMLVVGQRTQTTFSSTLKRSKSSVSVESTTALYYYQRQEDQIWLYSQKQNCLEYLEELVALRRQYTRSVNDLKSTEMKATVSAKKKPAPPPPLASRRTQISEAKPSAPPVPNEENTLEFFDSVIASCDSEPKPHIDDGHADVDFIVATSTIEHDLHSNWVMRVPRGVLNEAKPPVPVKTSGKKNKAKKDEGGSTSSRRNLQRNPIHLPKVVESAFQTLRFKPRLKKNKD